MDKWNQLLSGLPAHIYSGPNDLTTDESGWVWVAVGRNASHEFYVGHSGDFARFAMKSCGEGREEGSWDEKVYRESSNLDTTLAGAYLGHW